MPVIYRCDGCGKEAPAEKAYNGRSIKPHKWYSRSDKDGEQIACSRACIELISKKTGKTGVVAPW